jgi:hypothetical protein
LKNKVFGIGGEHYHHSSVYSHADMVNFPMGMGMNYIPFGYFGTPMDNMMYSQPMNPTYYNNMNMRNPMHMNYMRQ